MKLYIYGIAKWIYLAVVAYKNQNVCLDNYAFKEGLNPTLFIFVPLLIEN